MNQKWKKRTTLGWIWLALAMILASPKSQAQLFIDVYPSQDNANQTLWIFSRGNTSNAKYGNTIRSSGSYHARDSWKIGSSINAGGPNPNFYTANKPTNRLFSLSPLFSSTNHPKDIESIQKRLQGIAKPTYLEDASPSGFPNSATNAPTITIGGVNKTIGWIFMNDAERDEMGIRGTPPNNLAYTNGQPTSWFGSGIIDKPIGDFLVGTSDNGQSQNQPQFTSWVRWHTSARIIPEPEEYAFMFGLFALGFMFFRRRFQKKELRNER